jgi:hypothetical protein
MDDELEMVRFEVLTAIVIMLHKSWVLAVLALYVFAGRCRRFGDSLTSHSPCSLRLI